MQVKDTGFCDAAAAFTDIHNTPCDQVLKSYIKGSHVLTAILGFFIGSSLKTGLIMLVGI